MEKDTEAAIHWIVELLQRHNIPFQISGGFAARMYGSKRPLADIDISTPDEALETLYPDVKKYVIFGPERFKDGQWDLRLMTLKYAGQEIDMCGENSIRYFDSLTGDWVSGSGDLSRSEMKEVYGLTLPFMPKADLITYKKKLMRPVDQEDLAMLSTHD